VQLPYAKANGAQILRKSFYTFQTKTESIFTQIQRWILEKQLIEPKVQRLYHGNHSINPTTTPLTSNPRNSLTESPIELNFGEGLH